MVEPRDDDVVAGAEQAPDGAAEHERERRHVRPELDAPGRRVQEVLERLVGGFDHAIALLRT